MEKYIHQELTEKVIKYYYKIYNTLGFGFLEKVYEKSLILELTKNGIFFEKQKPIKIYYDSEIVGDYIADIIVENKIILEIKATEILKEEHELQLINYLKATQIELGLLLNFGKVPEIRRKIFTNDRKELFTK
ncbi:MAG: GxxExxY protein [Ignavibacteria bacterium]|nr:GxxExxY protein [Ignavibacteria bacterium]